MVRNHKLLDLRGWYKEGQTQSALRDCALAVPTYCRSEAVGRLLHVLLDIEDPPSEVVIIDGSPDTNTFEIVRTFATSHALPFRLSYVKTEAGLTRQRNIAVDATGSEFLFFLDDDCQPLQGYFLNIRRTFSLAGDRAVGAVCGTIVNEMDHPLRARWKIRLALGLVQHGEPGQYLDNATSVPRSLTKLFDGTKRVDIVPGGAVAYRREVFSKHRFSYFFAGYSQGEDVEMSLRIGRDYDLVWCGNAHVIHHHQGGGRPRPLNKGIMDVRNRFFIWRRYSPQPSIAASVRFWADILYVLLLSVGRGIFTVDADALKHGVGVALGATKCLVSPPGYDEPPSQREFNVIYESISGCSARTEP